MPVRVPPVQRAASGRSPLLRFLALNLGIGVGIGVALAAAAILSDFGGLKSLISGTEAPLVAVAMLYVMFALTFGSLAMGVAVMALPYGPNGPVEPPIPSAGGKDRPASGAE